MTNIQQKLAALTADCIRFKSIDAPAYREELHRVVAWVAARFKKLPGVYVRRFFVQEKPGLVVTFERALEKPTVFLNGHLDVVPGEQHQFSPTIRNGRLYGRGAYDMKGACAVMIALAEHFAKQEKKPDVGFMFVTDEEAQGDQSEMLFKSGYHPKLFIAVEPTDFTIVTETKGILWVEGKIPGKAAHGSEPWLGRSPLVGFYDGLRKFYQCFPTLRRKQWVTTANIGEVRSGDCYNRIPPDLTFKIDMRYVSKDDPRVFMQKVKRSFPDNTQWKIERCDPPHRKAKDMVLIRQLKKIADGARVPTRYGRAPFATDARFFSAGGIASAVFGPKGGGAHSADEWVEIAG
ncbi:M20/M25/M40 family metallo-hydrolase, partial [Candidatus Uhrbacteria bacterium]|nr:M20/M25/M40 family metallo-hydrolase [Candidatus Uhrbacteria bacterium]